jgi:predicted P-loop ATPase
MSAAAVLSGFAELVEKPLTAEDYRNLAARWLRPEDAAAAGLYRVDGPSGAYLMGSPRKSFPGVCIPYLDPVTGDVVLHRIRVDDAARPAQIGMDGKMKTAPKYQGARESRNHGYFPRGVTAEHLAAVELPIVIAEGEFKTLALWRLANHESAAARFLPVGLSGVWNWRGKTGRRTAADGTRQDEHGVIPDMRRIAWEGRRVVIAFDADLEAKPQVKAARFTLSRELRAAGAVVAFLEWDAAEGKGIDDRLAKLGADEVLADYDALDFDRTTGWKAKLQRGEPTRKNEQGKVLANEFNVRTALANAPEWEGVFEFNELTQRVRAVQPPPIGGPVPRDWTDADDINTTIWMQANGIQVRGKETVGSCVQGQALQNSVNPLRDYLEALEWDGEPRVDGWLNEYFGVEPSSYSASVGRWWLISAVARVLRPGFVQADHMLVLEGDQGIGKSSALRALAGDDYFTDAAIDLHNKDASMQALSYWIIEWGELGALRKADIEAVKAFITKRSESFRPPYGKRVEDVRRYCVFAGTTNRGDYLKDETGNRRFWPVRCTRADAARIAADRDQIWAQAVMLFKEGAKWWPDNPKLIEAIEAEQAERMEADPWQAEVERFVEAKDRVTAEAVLVHLGFEVSRMGRVERNRVGRCLRECGFKPTTVREHGQVTRCFVRSK